MAEFFHDGYVRDTDPLDGAMGHTDFDYDESEDNKSGETFDAAVDELNDEDRAALGQALAIILAWLCNTPLRMGADAYVGRRAISMLWVMRPETFASKSLSQLSEILGISRATLSKEAARFTRTFGLRNRGQSHGWNRIESKPTPIKNLAA